MTIARDDDAQPRWDEATVKPMIPINATPLAIARRGRFVYLRAAKQLGAGCLDEIHPECPKCGRTWPAPHLNPFFSKVIGTPVYSQYVTCEACLSEIDAAADSQKYEAKLRELEGLGFTQVQRAWTFDTYPQQGSPWLRRARQFVQNPVHDILIYGNPGVGKTGLAVAILRALWTDRRRVRAIRASEMIMSLRGTDAAHTQALMRELGAAEFLLLDDLSAIKRTEFWEEILDVLIEIRQQDNKITILTANITIGKADPSAVLAEFFGYVAYDRLVERGEFWQMKGTSARQAWHERKAEPTGQSRFEQHYRE